jgi:hypothetical protein
MSGNSTRMGVSFADGQFAAAALAPGTLVGIATKRRH